MLDVLIKNGRIVDGSGNPWFYGDVGINEGKIVQVGKVDQESRQVIDAKKQVVSPGFIDGHCHSDLMILNYPQSEIKLQQGVTTEVVGNCGLSPTPFFGEYAHLLKKYVQPVIGSSRKEWSWKTVEDYAETIRQARPSENITTYVAHGTLRILVMGFEKRPATKEEVDRMKVLLEEGMQAGAIGLSIGLLYAPGSFSTKEEIAELCSVLPKYDGLLSTHIRGEGNNLIPSIKEVIWIAETAGIPLHVSHLKAAGKRNWELVEHAMEVITDAREKGLDVTCDVYPYSASSTMLLTVLPPWVLEGGVQATLERFKDQIIRGKIREELANEQEDWDNLVCSTGWENVVISSVQTDKNRGLEGKSIAAISEIRGAHPVDCVLDLLLEEGGDVSIVYFLMSDDDVSKVVQWDHSLIASDSLHCDTGKPHPRLYGSFPRVFAKYVREDRLLSLEHAVRKITSFPVQRFKLGKRGLLVPGYAADIVVFNPDTIQDEATYQHPKNFPNGISHVWVNGKMTLENGNHTKAREGTFIKANCNH
ncbi:N-acyl-D-amino-acid deacylase family protein [Pseudogracilibacillus auburnensis]|uniref:N-acyl-D-amino-acid deacylase family protein n=1 Tax=Pseudogracilibacillus auburnensis TaxID=1494959 RepID=UPI001A96D2EA|nr:D-aminoacylase [Pseudogracilibacillus auburnensis]MBO1004813.1 D-aminoacylase [Pseudogracilibacillus auburnensis]